ncbi:beta-L-arabinofuranosidase domain-containing protein [Streptomyces sp. NPDC049881]|uniref:beta-L-arabinofuranosidase domain-containing protein n=1 Tax=Streptomyces sp. NPDC049881 TaxID=3155778 RepID=UPI00343BECA3
MGIRHEPVRLGEIRPQGWLRRQLELQATGLTGRLEEIWPDTGPRSAWLGGDGEDWERGPYYLDGLVPLAHVLGDEALLGKAQKWIEAILAGQRPDGQFGPGTNEDWWPRMVALKVLVQHADATGDDRVPGFLARYFAYQLAHLPDRPLEEWGAYRATENVLAVLWLHRREPDPRWPELCARLLEQNADWTGYLTGDLITGRATVFDHLTHGPNVAMGLKEPAVRALIDGDQERYADLRACLAALDRWHGQAHGMFSGDEWLAGREAYQGVETCQVVEYLYTLEQSGLAFGEGELGDLAELVAFNHLAASCDERMLSHQYHQQATQVSATVDRRRWTHSSDEANIFGLEPHYGCCLANFHQGWPKFAASLWMRLPEDEGLAVFAYAPSTLRTRVGGADVTIEESTDYPFEDTVRLAVDVSEPTAFTLRLRVPRWCDAPELLLNGERHPLETGDDGYAAVRRTWRPGDTLQLRLPMAIRRVRRERNAVGVRLGPLVMVVPVEEGWRPLPAPRGLGEWEVVPLSSWNYGLHLRGRGGLENWRVERAPVSAVPFDRRAVPVTIHGRAATVPSWDLRDGSAAEPPDSPVVTGSPVVDRTLVPYGFARLRVAEMPTVLSVAADGHEVP